MKYFALDIETTSLDVEHGYILEIGCVYVENFEIKSQFNQIIYRETIAGTITAILMNKDLLSLCQDRDRTILSIDLIPKLNNFILQYSNKPVFAGKNISGFDLPFLKRHACRYNQRLINYHHRVIDVGSLYLQKNDEVVPGMKECMSRAGLEYVETHRALIDCYNVIRCITARLK